MTFFFFPPVSFHLEMCVCVMMIMDVYFYSRNQESNSEDEASPKTRYRDFVPKPVCPKGNQPWIFIGRTDAETEAPICWPPDVKSWLIGKDPDAGKDGGQEEKGVIEDEMVGWHHQVNGHEFEQTREMVKDREDKL